MNKKEMFRKCQQDVNHSTQVEIVMSSFSLIIAMYSIRYTGSR